MSYRRYSESPKTSLPRWLSGKESTCQCRRLRFDPWVWKQEGNGNPLQYSCPEAPMNRVVWWLQSMESQSRTQPSNNNTLHTSHQPRNIIQVCPGTRHFLTSTSKQVLFVPSKASLTTSCKLPVGSKSHLNLHISLFKQCLGITSTLQDRWDVFMAAQPLTFPLLSHDAGELPSMMGTLSAARTIDLTWLPPEL